MAKLNEMTENELINYIQSSDRRQDAATALLHYRTWQRLNETLNKMDSVINDFQNHFNSATISNEKITKSMNRATWIIAFATILNILASIVNYFLTK
ncbi:MAG: hypothetical protein AB1546_04740 [bacterium]